MPLVWGKEGGYVQKSVWRYRVMFASSGWRMDEWRMDARRSADGEVMSWSRGKFSA